MESARRGTPHLVTAREARPHSAVAASFDTDGSQPGLNVEVRRFKGLGDLDADQPWVTTMEPQRRKLLRVNISAQDLDI